MRTSKSDFLNVLAERGFIPQVSAPETLDALARSSTITAYIGFDCTADSLHVGNLVQLMTLRRLQQAGHRPILLMGATNVPWQLDQAMLRPGRFDDKVYIPLPDLPGRREMLNQYLARRPVAADVNFDSLAARLEGYSGADIRYIVIHDTEVSYAETVKIFQTPTAYASAHYVVQSPNGQITQMIRTKNIAWHAGNYFVNMHSIGIEHVGVAIDGAHWYTEQLYRESARLVRYLAKRYHVPLDRAHIVGHDNVPGPTPSTQTDQHWDPGPFWDCQHYMELLCAPVRMGPATSPIIQIAPDFALNQPEMTYCATTTTCAPVPQQPANFLYVYTAPSFAAPLVSDPALHSAGQAGTTQANDWGDKAPTGAEYYRLKTQGDWDAIDFAGQLAWIYNPGHRLTVPGTGRLVTPKSGLASIPVYGRAYPDASSYPASIQPQPIISLQYMIPAGQIYVAINLVTSDYYDSPTQTQHTVVQGTSKYFQIFFNQRFGLLRQSDVTVVKPTGQR